MGVPVIDLSGLGRGGGRASEWPANQFDQGVADTTAVRHRRMATRFDSRQLFRAPVIFVRFFCHALLFHGSRIEGHSLDLGACRQESLRIRLNQFTGEKIHTSFLPLSGNLFSLCSTAAATYSGFQWRYLVNCDFYSGRYFHGKDTGRGRIYGNIAETIGDTPIVGLDKLAKKHKVKANLLAKLEFFNPIASVKDRIGVKLDRGDGKEGSDQAGQIRFD